MAEIDHLDSNAAEKELARNEDMARKESVDGQSDESERGQQDEQARSPTLTQEPPSEASRNDAQRLQQYSVFTTKEKRMMILAGSFAGFFSPLSSTIYFPALNTIAKALHVSGSKINLTVTSYVILQGIAPMMIAGFSDNVGRRPAYVLCFTIFLFANLGLGLQNSYAALLVLRCLQSAGSSGTIALSNGIVGDMVTSEERGSYIAFASIGGLLGPAIAPVIGGAITQSLDYHWLFWFLLIFTGVFCVPLFLFMPETCRKVVGDGSVPPPKWYWCLTDTLRFRRLRRNGFEIDKAKQAQLHQNLRFQFPNPIPTILIITDPESFIILVATGLCLACFYAISTGAASAFGEIYGFNDIEIALVFIPVAVGGIVAALTTGKMMDWNYRRHAHKKGITVVKGVRQDLGEFPIETARMEVAIPIGYATIATYQAYNVLMVDIWPSRPAAASAANNFIRCSLGAAASAAIEPMVKGTGRGWAYTTIALLQGISVPFLFLLMRQGIQMRKVKAEKQTRKLIQKEGRGELPT
ncbi:hypothetical protein LTR84_003335 [Exophiala bonariae]|uniref:Major facilitator superfamily (MFS) profile domain-containing protein n=1 Tax=Exophiala bonariae TaxID=1690606 RepID=A0AAV9NAC8_9EURO|nr:hypothetical protein LTR84_003335 [Exophiala bonariae]